MQQHVGEVMSTSVTPVDLVIEHVREPGKRMPIIGMTACKRPNHSVRRETTGDLRIVINIYRVIIINEVVTKRPPEDQPRNRRQKKTNTGYRHQSVTPLVRTNLWHSGTILSHANERTISPNMQFCFLKNH